MGASQHHKISIPDKSYASIAKREVTRMAEAMGMAAGEVGRVNIVVSEMLSNLTKYAPQGGELLVRPLSGAPSDGIEVICLDNGPGIADPSRMLQDGVSTYGSAGEGLGAMKRQSDVFDLYSQPGNGTVILSRVYRSSRQHLASHAANNIDIGYVLVAKPREIVCGDGLAIIEKQKEIYLLTLDGLGHGENAHEASQQAAQVFSASPALPPSQALRNIHQNIKRTRGAVGMAAIINAVNHRITYCGVGNITAKLYAPDAPLGSNACKNMLSYNGILGHNIPTTLNDQQLEWSRYQLLVLHSDGLKSRWDFSKYNSLNRHLPTTVAALLYKDQSRQTDDTLVVVCRSKV